MPGSETALVSLWVVWVADEKYFFLLKNLRCPTESSGFFLPKQLERRSLTFLKPILFSEK